MKTKILRIVGALAAAVLVAIALLIAVEGFSEVVYPAPPQAKHDYQALCAHVANYPHWVLALVVPMWAFIPFISTWLAGRIGNRICALVIALLLLTALCANIAMLPYPLWFKIVQPLALFFGAALAFLLLPRPSAAPTTSYQPDAPARE